MGTPSVTSGRRGRRRQARDLSSRSSLSQAVRRNGQILKCSMRAIPSTKIRGSEDAGARFVQRLSAWRPHNSSLSTVSWRGRHATLFTKDGLIAHGSMGTTCGMVIPLAGAKFRQVSGLIGNGKAV